jgi:signal transduction histidine kinase
VKHLHIPAIFHQTGRWANQSIQRKLVIWSIGFWVISLSVVSLVLLWVGQTGITDQTRQRNVQLASVIGRDINAQIGGILSDIRFFSRRLEESDSDLTQQADIALSLRLSSPQRYRSIYYYDNTGALAFYINDPQPSLLSLNPRDILSRPPLPVDTAVKETYQRSDRAGIFISDVYFSNLDRTPVFYAGTHMTVSDNDTRIVVLELDLNDMWQHVNLSTVGQTGSTYAISEKGIVISHQSPALVGTQIPAELRPVLEGFEGFTEYQAEIPQKRQVFAAYSPVGGPTGWGIAVEQDRSEAELPLYRVGFIVVIVWLIVAVIGTVSILLVIRNFTKPIIKLTKATHEIAQTGDLTKTTAVVNRADEVGQMSQAFDQMIDRLQKTEGRLAQVAAEERNRLARDLHDAVSQTLFSASLIAEVLPRLWDRNQAEGRRRLEEVRQLTRGALAEMRTLLLELRPSALVEADIGYLLKQLGESINGRSRIPVTVEIAGDVAMPNDVKIALYRIAQESLNNIAKHSGAQTAKVNLDCGPEQVVLRIADDGHGFDVAANSQKSLGMGIIRERAREIGAALKIHSTIDKGTIITTAWTRT